MHDNCFTQSNTKLYFPNPTFLLLKKYIIIFFLNQWENVDKEMYIFLSFDKFFLILLTFRMWLFESKLNATKQFDYHVKNKASEISLKYTFITLNYSSNILLHNS